MPPVGGSAGDSVTSAPPALCFSSGARAGTRLFVADELLLGRTVDGEGRLGDDPKISRRHARISRGAGASLVVEDLGSANGTFVNGSRLAEPRIVHIGDTIGIGNSELRVEPFDEPGRTTTIAPGSGDVVSGGDGVHEPQRRSSDGTLLYRGSRFTLGRSQVTAGRASDNTICLGGERVSRHHARFDATDDGFWVTDLGSRNGTYVNGELVRAERHSLASGDTVSVGGEPIRFLAGQATVFADQLPQGVKGTQTIRLQGDQLTIGRDPTNDVVLDDPNVSRFHAQVVSVSDGWALRDLGSRNGTRLNGSLIDRGRIEAGSEIGVGPFRLVFDGASIVARDDRGSLRLAADQATVEVNGHKRILDGVSLEIPPGDFVAIIGEAGSGKTTLLTTLAGVTHPNSGAVTVNGDPVSARLSEIGYVPQDEIVHPELTVREALTYAARLRLPQDSSQAEIRAAVDQVLAELAMEEHAETKVGNLSGGQRKRAGFGTELVNRPGLLFLDEVTTGLDPGLERKLMELMCQISGTRTVITITHATKNLGLCDKVIIMGRGGRLCFFGPPDESLGYFGVSDYDAIYIELDQAPVEYWPERWAAFVREGGRQREEAPPTPLQFARPRADRTIGNQAQILASRYFVLFRRDRRNLIILLGQVPLLAILVALLFHRDVLVFGNGESSNAIQLIFLMVVIVVWCGSIDSAREIIKERAVFDRERAVGVRNTAFLLSKTSLLFTLTLVQTVLLCAIIFALRPVHQASTAYVVVAAFLALSSWVAVMLGLLLSANVRTENQATSFIPLILIPELILSGGATPLHQLPSALQVFAGAIFPRWSYAALGDVIRFNQRFARDPTGAVQFQQNGHTFFLLSPWIGASVLTLFLLVFAGGVLLSLRRER